MKVFFAGHWSNQGNDCSAPSFYFIFLTPAPYASCFYFLRRLSYLLHVTAFLSTQQPELPWQDYTTPDTHALNPAPYKATPLDSHLPLFLFLYNTKASNSSRRTRKRQPAPAPACMILLSKLIGSLPMKSQKPWVRENDSYFEILWWGPKSTKISLLSINGSIHLCFA